jgi:PAS domain S-box-containing protein
MREAGLALRDRQERLAIALDAANVGTWDWNIRTGEVRWSDNLERIHGQAQGAFRGAFEGFLVGVHPEDRPAVLKAIHRAIATGEKYEIEYRSLRADGASMWLEGRGRVFRDETGEPRYDGASSTARTPPPESAPRKPLRARWRHWA